VLLIDELLRRDACAARLGLTAWSSGSRRSARAVLGRREFVGRLCGYWRRRLPVRRDSSRSQRRQQFGNVGTVGAVWLYC
jgi:hypothetical protein